MRRAAGRESRCPTAGLCMWTRPYVRRVYRNMVKVVLYVCECVNVCLCVPLLVLNRDMVTLDELL